MAKKRIEKKMESFEEMVARLSSKVQKDAFEDDRPQQSLVAYFEGFRIASNGFLNIAGKDGKERFVDITVHPKRSKIQQAFFSLLDAIDKKGVSLTPTETLDETALRIKITGAQEVSRNKIKVWLNRSPDFEIKTPTGELFKLADFMPTETPRQLEEDEEIPF